MATKTVKPVVKPKVTAGGAEPVGAKGETIALLIDLANTGASYNNVLEIFSILANQGKIVFAKFYGFDGERKEIFAEFVKDKNMLTAGNATFKHGEGSVVDARQISDAFMLAKSGKFTSIFLWTGVGDLSTTFALLKDYKVKTIAPRFEIFDTDNKFVDQKVKLFSPHALPVLEQPMKHVGGPVAVPTQVVTAQVPIMPPPMPQQVQQQVAQPLQQAPVIGGVAQEVGLPRAAVLVDLDPLAGAPTPALPRKMGAPGFGEVATNMPAPSSLLEEEKDEDDIDIKDLSDTEYLAALAYDLLQSVEADAGSPEYMDSMGDLFRAPTADSSEDPPDVFYDESDDNIDKYDGGISHKYDPNYVEPEKEKSATEVYQENISDFNRPSNFAGSGAGSGGESE